jgi:hypothetical protein
LADGAYMCPELFRFLNKTRISLQDIASRTPPAKFLPRCR